MADTESAGADILTEQRMIALAPDHPLARQEKLTLADLRDEPVIGPTRICPRRCCGSGTWIRVRTVRAPDWDRPPTRRRSVCCT
ncbi:LysR substrate-binding domain-containing protein [Streptomyces nigra]|uniref:LysR substrate-binding domain-containing protein n=1 Tax=Streptomyces nigra TaxID=1827580 RepID=UPI0036318FC7